MQGRLTLPYVLMSCLVFILAVEVPLMANTGMIEEWVTRYNSPADGYDSARAIAIDSFGNVYVTGKSGSGTYHDYNTVKYDPAGNRLWVQQYNGTGNGEDEAVAIAVDALGNVYVTGKSDGDETGSDYATVKYDPDGNQIWVRRYNGPANDKDRAEAIGVDASGNVYVTGWSWDIGTNVSYITVKYDTNGNELWVKRYTGLRKGYSEYFVAIAVDASGNVYVTGKSDGDGTYSDYATVKYDTDGNELWVRRYNGPANGYDSTYAIAADASGNVYVTGWSEGCGTNDDYATVKYDPDGNELWVKRYNGPASSYDRAHAIVADASGNVYVTGKSDGDETGSDYATVKYDTDGNQLWVRRYNGPANGYDYAWALTVDTSGNVYVTGGSYGGATRDDYATIKYDTDGNELWVNRYNGPGNSDDAAEAIAVDPSGSIYVTGWSWGDKTYHDYATMKYDTDGNELWVSRYNGLGESEDAARDIAIDASGNIYVTGRSRDDDGTDYATVKYDPDGHQLWVRRYDGPAHDEDGAEAIAVDASGNVYVTGWSWDIGTNVDYITVKYDTEGNELWVARYDGPASGRDFASALAIDASGNIYVTGESRGDGTGSDYATVKYDPDGHQLWVARYDGPANDRDFASALAIDASGNIYVTGESEGEGTGRDYATVKYDTEGNELWVARYDSPANHGDSANAIAIDASGKVYVTGDSFDSKTYSDYTTVKYDTDGNELWVARYNGPGNGTDVTNAIAVNASGNVYVTGWSEGIGTGYDYATVKYDPHGNELWVKRYTGLESSYDEARAVAIDAAGNIYVTGKSDGDYATIKYDTNGNELWVARYDGPANCGDSASAIAIDASGNVYVTGSSHGGRTGVDYATVKYGEGVKMEFPAGWSMISLPVTPAVATLTTLFPDAVVVYKYQKGTGYVRVTGSENLEVGMGYWILLNNPESYMIRGTAITEYTMPVADGWYMIGGCTDPAQTMVTTGSIDVIYEYTQGSGYTRVTGSGSLEREKGYWILFSNTSEGAEFTASSSASE